MKLRFFYFLLHLGLTVVVLGVVYAFFSFNGYDWPAWYLQGADKVAFLIALVALVVGPLATLLVSSARKPKRDLHLDLVVIVLLQSLALGYGALTLWQSRPLFYAFSVNQVELIPISYFASEQERESLNNALHRLVPEGGVRPFWFWVPLPDNEKEAMSLVYSAVTEGRDITSKPEYFHAWNDGLEDLRTNLHAMSELRGRLGLDEPAWLKLTNDLGQDLSLMGWLPVVGIKREGVMIFQREGGKVIRFVRAPSAN